MRLKSIYIITIFLILLFYCIEIGCIDTDKVVYTNPNYPDVEIVKFLTSNPYPYLPGFHLSIDVLINSTEPETGIRLPNGSVEYSGKSVTVPVTAFVEGIGNKTEYVNISYNETKTVSIDFEWNVNAVGYHKIVVTTPSMQKEMVLTVFDGRI